MEKQKHGSALTEKGGDGMNDIDKVIKALEEAEVTNGVIKMSDQFRDVLVALLKEKEAEAKWIYGEDKTGVDGWYCSECNFFEPWFYEFTEDIDFIRFYGHCPKCGRRMTSYTGKPTQERR